MSEEQRRKALRVAVPIDFYFNVMGSAAEYTRANTSVLRRLGAIDALKAPPARTESQIFLSRIDQKLTLLVGILAANSSHKSYINHSVVEDISETGLSFNHTMTIDKGTALEIGLQLPMDDNTRVMDIGGMVVNVKPSPGKHGELNHIYGVEFFDIQGKDQNDIVQWIFAHQREQIRRRREKESF
jgi:c-di-GMP-binding flagellar brake protein YcgR